MFRGNATFERLYEGRGSSGKSSFTLPFLLMMVLLFILVIALLAFVLYRNTRDRKPTYETRDQRNMTFQRNLQKRKDVISTAATEYGIDDDDINNILLADTDTDTPEISCLVAPVNGKCNENFYKLVGDCCHLHDTSDVEARRERMEMFRDMGFRISVVIFTEYLITKVLPTIGKRIHSISSKGLSKAIAKTARMTASKVALYTTARLGRWMMKLGGGPVGWALFVFEMMSLVLDLGDMKNYGSYIENEGIIKSRDTMIYKFQEALTEAKASYPMLFPYDSIMPDESTIASEELMKHLFVTDKYLNELTILPGGIEYLTELLLKAVQATQDNQIVEESEEEAAEGMSVAERWISNVRKKYAKELDKYVFDILKSELPAERKNDIFLVPSMSDENTIGISISKEAGERWNEENKPTWFKYFDPFYPEPPPEEDWIPPFTAIYTDRYLGLDKINPGVANEPKLVWSSLPRSVTLCYPFGPIISLCEKSRTSAKHKDPIDPKQYGVTYNYETGICQYTEEYCKRYGIDYKDRTWKDGTPYAECELSEDQKWAEFFLGEQIVRNAKSYWDDPSNIEKDLGQLYDDRKEKYGTHTARYLMLVDPFGVSEAGEGAIKGWGEQMAGKEKWCNPGDTCKRFTAEHKGGNFMTWSARDATNNIYPHPQHVQGQVKAGEDHYFYVPEGGNFRVKCEPGEGGNFTYDEIPADGKKSFTCWNGKLNKDFDIFDTPEAAYDAVKTGFSADVDSGNLNIGMPGMTTSVGEDGFHMKGGMGGKVSVDSSGVEISALGNSFVANEEKVELDTLFAHASVGKDGVAMGGLGFGMEADKHGVGFDTPIGGVSIGSGGIKFKKPSWLSDKRLKNNIRKTKIKSPIEGLTVYSWTWNETAMSTYGLRGRDFGFLTQDIDDKYLEIDSFGYQHISHGTPIYEALEQLKSQYKVK